MAEVDSIAVITRAGELEEACATFASAEFITVDTEFLRDKTYYPRLCLIQIAGPDHAVLIDAIAPGIDLAPVFALFANPKVLKVFHAAQQDIEILYHLSGQVPTPIFDTQVAAMVCGFGEAASYATLAAELAGATIDKSSRFTDWSRRPLSSQQLHYALSDVTYLRTIYQELARRLDNVNRRHWLHEEMAYLVNPQSYHVDPKDIWKKIKPKSNSARFLTIVQALAEWREITARALDMPRSHVLKDTVLLEIAASTPLSLKELRAIRGVTNPVAKEQWGQQCIEVVAKAVELKPDRELLSQQRYGNLPKGGALVDLLKVLLKMKCEECHVAEKLVATSEDIALIAHTPAPQENTEIPAMHGWRFEIFGKDALALKEGKLALSATRNGMKLIVL